MPTEEASANTANLVPPTDESNTLPVSCLPPSSTTVPLCLAPFGAATSASGDSSRTHCQRGQQRQTPWRHAAVVKAAAAGRRVCRKYRRVYIRRLQETEFDKLRRMVPALRALEESRRRLKDRSQQRQQSQHLSTSRRHVSKITVIEETIRYIDLLHRKLTDRLMNDENIISAAYVDEKSVVEAAKMAFILTNSNNEDDSCCLGDWQQQSQFSTVVNPWTSDIAPIVKATMPDRFQS